MIYVIGGGAAGFFAAITCAQANPTAQVTILERGKNVLEKVRISGGGRCNVTHACFLPKELTKNYPRGERELLAPFTRFSAADTIEWFEQHGVHLKIEADGRMFPTTDRSETIVDCLVYTARRANVRIETSKRVESISRTDAQDWHIHLANGDTLLAEKIIIATGSNAAVWDWLGALGHRVILPVPSLFTFNIKDVRIADLSGLSVPNAVVRVLNVPKLEASGALLVTHWGLSGPAVLRLSAWGARSLAELRHYFDIQVSWIGEVKIPVVFDELNEQKHTNPRKQIAANAQYDLPQRLWKNICTAAQITDTQRWADASKKQLQTLATELCAATFSVTGKSTHKDEFVTAGGVDLSEVQFKTFESKLHPNLFFAGEVLDIDAITGGFNFQAAWTSGWHAGNAAARDLV